MSAFKSKRGAIVLLSGSSNRGLAEGISDAIGTPLEDTDNGRFADGEVKIQIRNNIRDGDAYLIQPTCPPKVNSGVLELLLMIDTLRKSSAKNVTAVVPYFAYARQDRKAESRVPISASVIARLIETVRPDRLVTVDLHCGQIQGFFQKIPVDNLSTVKLFVEYFREHSGLEDKKDNIVIVSPDAGGVARAKKFADTWGIDSVVTILKRRSEANKVGEMQLVGEDFTGKICIIVDDMIDTAGTLCKAAEKLKKCGAAEVHACASHGVFSGPAYGRIDTCPALTKVYVTDTIPQRSGCSDKITYVTISKLLGKAIEHLHKGYSLSVLF